jgi:copper transport protein
LTIFSFYEGNRGYCKYRENDEKYETPSSSLPLFPVFDSARHSIWVGDTTPNSGRIWQLNIDTGKYAEHKIQGANIITVIALAPDGKLWYVDPLTKQPNGTLGLYDPDAKSAKQFVIPSEGIPTGLAIDNDGNLWMPILESNKVAKYTPATGQFTFYDIPTANAEPAGIITDSQGNVWFAEAIGKIAKIDVSSGKITEYAPKRDDQALGEPAAIFEDVKSPGTLYISEHTGHTVTAFNTLLDTFHKYPSPDNSGAPFGMAMDSYGNLWIAEHLIDKVALIDPRTGASKEANIPVAGSFIQYLTVDDSGKVWFAAQRGNGLGSISVTAKPPAQPPAAGGGSGEEEQANSPPSNGGGIQQLGLQFPVVIAPGIAAGIVLSALFYAKSSIDLNRNMRTALRMRN